MQSPETRAKQHLLVQGFSLMTSQAAVCSRLVAIGYLDNPALPWAVLFDTESMQWTSTLPAEDPLKPLFAEAAVRSATPATPHVVCHTQGGWLLLPLVTADVRDARMRIEGAVAQGKAPPAERLEAFPDELIEREAKRREKKRRKEDEQPGTPEIG